jgi:hypothetical protein
VNKAFPPKATPVLWAEGIVYCILSDRDANRTVGELGVGASRSGWWTSQRSIERGPERRYDGSTIRYEEAFPDQRGSRLPYLLRNRRSQRQPRDCIFTIVALAAISAMAVLFGGFGRTALVLSAALTVDYAIRAWTRIPSPMQRLARWSARAAGIPEKRSGAAPKRFACRIGFFFALGTVAVILYPRGLRP